MTLSGEGRATLSRAVGAFRGLSAAETFHRVAEALRVVKHPDELRFGEAVAGLYCPFGVALGALLSGLPDCAERDLLLYIWAWRAGGASAVHTLPRIDSTPLRAAAALACVVGDGPRRDGERLPTKVDASALEVIEGMLLVVENDAAARAICGWAVSQS